MAQRLQLVFGLALDAPRRSSLRHAICGVAQHAYGCA